MNNLHNLIAELTRLRDRDHVPGNTSITINGLPITTLDRSHGDDAHLPNINLGTKVSSTTPDPWKRYERY